jgi:YhcH/YjgK/YiaL family protein
MITCNLSRITKYDYQNARFRAAFDFLRNNDLLSLTPGTEIPVCDGVLAKIQEYTTDPEETRRFETHRDYFDIQFVVRGEEFIGIVPAQGLTPDGEYDAANDLQYYVTPPKHGGAVLRDGDFLIVPPEDAHRPNCMTDKPSTVRKIVVKVKV